MTGFMDKETLRILACHANSGSPAKEDPASVRKWMSKIDECVEKTDKKDNLKKYSDIQSHVSTSNVHVSLDKKDKLFSVFDPEIAGCDDCREVKLSNLPKEDVLASGELVLNENASKNTNGVMKALELTLNGAIKDNGYKKLSNVVLAGHGVSYYKDASRSDVRAVDRYGREEFVDFVELAKAASGFVQPGGKLIFESCALLREGIPPAERAKKMHELQALSDKVGIEIQVARSEIMTAGFSTREIRIGAQQRNGRFVSFKPHEWPQYEVAAGDVTFHKVERLLHDKAPGTTYVTIGHSPIP